MLALAAVEDAETVEVAPSESEVVRVMIAAEPARGTVGSMVVESVTELVAARRRDWVAAVSCVEPAATVAVPMPAAEGASLEAWRLAGKRRRLGLCAICIVTGHYRRWW